MSSKKHYVRDCIVFAFVIIKTILELYSNAFIAKRQKFSIFEIFYIKNHVFKINDFVAINNFEQNENVKLRFAFFYFANFIR